VASQRRQLRWEPYVLWRDAEFGARWKDHFDEPPRNVLIIAGLGFDPRAVFVSQELIDAGGKGKRDLWLLCYDNGQGQPKRSGRQWPPTMLDFRHCSPPRGRSRVYP